MKRLFLILILVFAISHSFCFSQNKKLDSLLTLLKTDKEDTNKVKHLYIVCWEYYLVAEYDKGLYYGKLGLTLGETLSFKKGIANSYNNMGNIYYSQGNYPEALKNLFASLKIYEEIKNKKGIAGSYNNIGNIYINQGNYPEALKSHFAALKIREETRLPDGQVKDKYGLAVSHNNIGNIYYLQGNYPEALKNHFASLKIYEEIGDKQGIAVSYNNMGLIYQNQGNYPEALKNYFASLKINEEINGKNGIASSYNNIGIIYMNQGNYPEALKNYFKALKIEEEIGDKKGIADSYNNIGIIYKNQDNYPEAFKNHFASLKIYEEIGDKDGVACGFINLGNINSKENKTKEAQDYLNKALQLSKEIGNKDKMKLSYQALSTLDSIKGNYKEAFAHHKLFIIYRDSLNNEETKKKSLQSAMQYEFDKKEIASKAEQERLDAINAQEKTRQQFIIYGVAGVLLLVIIFSALLYKRFRLTTRQKQIIELKSIETEEQKQIIEEKHKEITDSINYAERILRSFIATKEILDENLNDYFVLFKPKDVVSGDFYWATKLENNNFVLVTADSTGHGVPGAIMSILNITCLENAVKEGIKEPSEILNHTRINIIERLKKDGSIEGGKDGMDASLISFDFKNNKFTYSAANNPVWVVREKQIIELGPDKMPVGKHDKDNVSFTQHSFDLQKGDTVYALTDGMPDQFGGPLGKKYMYKRLKELLISISNLPMQEQKETLQTSLNSWKGDLEQVDDITLIGIRI